MAFLGQYLRDWLRAQGAHLSNGQWIMNCPLCGKANHFYVSDKTGYWDCKKCGESGRSLKKPFVAIDGMLWFVHQAEIRKSMLQEELASDPPPNLFDDEEENEGSGLINTPLPKEFEPVFQAGKWNYPSYLRRRGMSRELARRLELGFCRTGEFGGRVIIPVECPFGRSFIGRAALEDQFPRYKAGKDAGRLLFGWQTLDWFSGPVVVVEGSFDVFSMINAGFSAVAMLTKNLSNAKRDLLLSLDRELVVMLDAGELEASVKVARAIGAAVAFPMADDPGEMIAKDGRRAVRNRMDWRQALLEDGEEELMALL